MMPNPSPARPATIEHFGVMAAMVQGAEELRWTRLNTLLLTDSIFFGGWVLLATTNSTDGKSVLLTLSCIPAIVLGVVFGFLGNRTSAYVREYREIASRLEDGVFDDENRPFASTRAHRRPKGVQRLTYSETLVTWIPVGSAIFFAVLALWPYWFA
jgi:hypothetical protein